jgi:hypothetical protein
MNKIIAIFALFSAAPVRAGEQGRESETAGIELSAEAIRNYGIETAKPAETETQTLPRAALVSAKDERFVYAKEGGRFIEIEIKPLQITSESVVFQDKDRAANKEYAISGAKYLRIIFLNNKNPAEVRGH